MFEISLYLCKSVERKSTYYYRKHYIQASDKIVSKKKQFDSMLYQAKFDMIFISFILIIIVNKI